MGCNTNFDKFPSIVVSHDKRKSRDYVNIVYKSRLSGFYFLHDHPETLVFMEDGAPVHSSKEASEWRQAHDINKLLWLQTLPTQTLSKTCGRSWKVPSSMRYYPKTKKDYLVSAIQKGIGRGVFRVSLQACLAIWRSWLKPKGVGSTFEMHAIYSYFLVSGFEILTTQTRLD